MDPVRIAIIGGSGVYQMPEVTDAIEHRLETPFGSPSDSIVVGRLHGQRVAFLPRHGRGHVLTPTEVPYRANIYALKSLGVTHVIGISAVGSLKLELEPGHVVVPDQIFDFTKGRARSFFEGGLVAHVSVADPLCPTLSTIVAQAARQAGGIVHQGGTFVTIEGPRFSTKAESQVWRGLGFSIIGMTASPEAFLAREAEMHYTVMAHVTDYDVWHTDETVTVDLIVARFAKNVALAQRAVAAAVERIAATGFACGCESALASALTTQRDRIAPEARQRLALLVDKYLK
ncbi:MAG TPA: S-methyl-5'-thioadenosine phosphorylase [Aggregatilineales bacterium]|nr:S-methyl-5'-thioadenosine phosphorylase [Aggregatilineales bacterium]